MAITSTLVIFTILSLSMLIFPSAQALTINGLPIDRVLIGGTVTCPDSLNVIQQAPVELRCGNSSSETVLRSTVTNLSGVYSFAFTTLDTLLFDPSTCFVRVTVPPNTCTVNIPNGFLRIPLVVLDVVQILLGNLLLVVQGAISILL